MSLPRQRAHWCAPSFTPLPLVGIVVLLQLHSPYSILSLRVPDFALLTFMSVVMSCILDDSEISTASDSPLRKHRSLLHFHLKCCGL